MRFVARLYLVTVVVLALIMIPLMGGTPAGISDEARYGSYTAGFLAYIGLLLMGLPGSLLLPAALPETRDPLVAFALTMASCALNASILFYFARKYGAPRADS